MATISDVGGRLHAAPKVEGWRPFANIGSQNVQHQVATVGAHDKDRVIRSATRRCERYQQALDGQPLAIN